MGKLMTCFRKVLILFPVFFFFSLSLCGWVKRTEVKSAMDEGSPETKKAADMATLQSRNLEKIE
jgi:hypothetical protein